MQHTLALCWLAPMLTISLLHTQLSSCCGEIERKIQNASCVFWQLFKTLWRKWIEQTGLERERRIKWKGGASHCVCLYCQRCRDVCVWLYIWWLLVLPHENIQSLQQTCAAFYFRDTFSALGWQFVIHTVPVVACLCFGANECSDVMPETSSLKEATLGTWAKSKHAGASPT